MPDSANPLGPALLDAISRELTLFLDTQETTTSQVVTGELLELARTFTDGGKRLRPAFCYWGHVAAAGHPQDPTGLLRASASLDLLHVSALVHDDIIDASDTRRGIPAAHHQFAAHHVAHHGRGDADTFGSAAAILLGDLLLMWSVELFEDSDLDPGRMSRARTLLSTMRTEVVCGQYLDVGASFGVTDVTDLEAEMEVARRILEYKTARYSVLRPLQVGAALGGGDDRLEAVLAEIGSLVGRAFQLRDDVLGVFGDPHVTGKPAGDDLREGKRTVLVLTALQRADAAQRSALDDALGNLAMSDGQLQAARAAIGATGALAEAERIIADDVDRAVATLRATSMTDEGRTALIRLAQLSGQRDH
ncbi:polyprenyl synthetase family protein [Tessaracoccus antarcticus]|uniref:Polyprenyl synthetase family protein n=1 Tax=Tessaracoccus antarcticus TaxID=2479848 RepID=A0A3M0GF91_9ACTN|nr:polyprenyl synthetase family protein [Tessaracoccus antarcticus]